MTAFTIHNLPYGVISTPANPAKRCAVAFESSAIDLDILYREGFFASIPELTENVFVSENWNTFAVLSNDIRASFRARIKSGIENGEVNSAKIALSDVQCHLPMATSNFSDFSCALEHAKNCSRVIGLPMPKNFFALPTAYNGRTTSLVVSGTPVTRPYGLFAEKNDPTNIAFKPESRMDFELEIGVWLSRPVPRGQRLDIAQAKDHIFGLTLLNDWSARSIQGFEMLPLGPFNSKSTATTVSPWIVPIEALEAVKCERKTKQDPPPPPHLALQEPEDTFDVELSVKLIRDGETYTLCESNLNVLHWVPVQQLVHLASAGAGLFPGDVFGTGTISTDKITAENEKIGLGCLFERVLPDTKLTSQLTDLSDTFLKDGDEIRLEGWCKDKHTGEILFGFGECSGTIVPCLEG